MDEEWELIDISGPLTCWTMPEESNSLLYSIGSHLIIWDFDNDNKYHLRCHNSHIGSLLFSPSSKHFISIESSVDPFISLWEFESLSQIHTSFLPTKQRKNPVFKIDSSLKDTSLLVLETEKEGGYRVSRWEWNENSLEFLDLTALEGKEKASKIRWMAGSCFFTTENVFVKIWDAAERIHLQKQLFFKSGVDDCEYCEDLSAFCILLKSYNFVIVDSAGAILTTFSQQYSAFAVKSEYLFLAGTSLQVYNLKNYGLISEILENGVRIVEIVVNGGSVACLKYENSMINVVDMERGSVLKVVAYHGTEINQLAWSLQGNFVSCGNENCVYLWEKQEIGWGLEAFELSKDMISTLAMCEGLMAVGYSNGSIWLYSDQMQCIGSSRLCSSKVSTLQFSTSKVLVAGFSNGLIIILDSTYSRTEAILQDESKLEKVLISLCELIDNHDNLLLVCTAKDPKTLSLHRVSRKGTCKAIGFTNTVLEGKYIDFKVHNSGKYVIAALDIGCTCIYEILNNKLIGVIECSGVMEIDSSGLYLSVLEEGQVSKISVFEVGTGDLVAEMGRIVNGKAIRWSYDGKLIGVFSSDGNIEIWKVPECVRFNIEKMLSRCESDIWDRFPIVYTNKTLKKKTNTIKFTNDVIANNSSFADTVVSLVTKKSPFKVIELPNFKAPEPFITKSSERDPVTQPTKLQKLYIPSSTETINPQPKQPRNSYIHKPQAFQNNLPPAIDSPVSLNSYKKPRNSILIANLGKDEPISFSKPVKRNSRLGATRPVTIDIERNLE